MRWSPVCARSAPDPDYITMTIRERGTERLSAIPAKTALVESDEK